MLYDSCGIINYSNDGWVIIKVDNSIVNYYKWWCEKLTWKKMSTPFYGAHITCVAGTYVHKSIIKHPNWKRFHGKRIDFKYSNIITYQHQQDGIYYWLPIVCNFVGDLRDGLDLPRKLKWDLHLTVAFRQK